MSGTREWHLSKFLAGFQKDRERVVQFKVFSYFLPVKLDDTVIITANVLKVGRNVAFAECEFRRKSDGKLAAKVNFFMGNLISENPFCAIVMTILHVFL